MNSMKIKMVLVACAALFSAGSAMAQTVLIQKSFGAATIPVNGTTTVSFTIFTGPAGSTGINFTDTLPPGLLVGTPPGIVNGCGGGTVTAVAASSTISLTGLNVGPNNGCTITANVTGTTPGIKVNSVSVADQNGAGNTSTATLTVLSLPPTITKAFGDPSVNINGTTTLSINITNPNATALTGVAVTDILPAGLLIGVPVGGTSNCGGVLTAAGATSTITLTGGALAANATCTITVNVTGVAQGTQVNTTGTVSSTESGVGLTATATLVVNPIIDPEEAFQVRYASNLPVGDSVVNLTNTGTLTVNGPNLTTTGNICVNVYTFDASEELISCCSCLVTPNGLNSLSARADLISNTLTPGVPTSIVIKLVASRPLGLSAAGTGGTCNPSSPTPLTVAPGMRAWGTTLHGLPTTPVTYGSTETEFATAPLGVAELTKLTTFCGFIQANGSGFGICKSCRTGGLGGAAK